MTRNLLASAVLAGVLACPAEVLGQSGPPRAGDRVRIEGPVRADRSLVAARVSRREWRAPVLVRGPISAIDPTATLLVVLGVQIAAAPLPNLDGVRSMADLRVGDLVEVEGLWGNRIVHASRIRFISASAWAAQDGLVEGPLEGLDADGFTLLGQRAWRPAAAARLDDQAAVEGGDPLVGRLRRDAEDQQIQSQIGGRWIIIGGRVDGSFVREENFDLETDGGRRHDRTTSGLQLHSLVTVPGGVEAFVKIKARHRVLARDERDASAAAEVGEAYVTWRPMASSPLSLYVGRQRFRDTRGWLFDADLDAVRVEMAAGRWTFEGALTDGVFASPASTHRADQRHLLVSAGVRASRLATVTGRVLARHDVARNEQPVYATLSAHGRIGQTVTYWSDIALRRGRAPGVTLRSWATDVGGTYQFRVRWNPAVSFGYASSSGDRSAGDGVDAMFRPTGLESNSYRIAGLKWLGYYGEVFDPELSNLRILTGALSLRPCRSCSIEGIYHRYTQVVLARRLPGNDLEAGGTGRSPDVGQGVDVVMAFRRRPVDLSLIVGAFLPGQAFDAASRPAVLLKPQVRVYF